MESIHQKLKYPLCLPISRKQNISLFVGFFHFSSLSRVRRRNIGTDRQSAREGNTPIVHDWKIDMACQRTTYSDALVSHAIISWASKKDITNKPLRIAVIEREPARLDLHDNPVTGLKSMGNFWQYDPIGLKHT